MTSDRNIYIRLGEVSRLTTYPPCPITLSMLSAHRLLDELITSLRNVIAPAIPDPYPKAQAYMAAVILEFIARQVEERHDIAVEKEQAMNGLFHDLTTILERKNLPELGDTDQEQRLCRLIEWLYSEKDRLDPDVFTVANQRIREVLRQLLDQELKVAGKNQD
jgi:hypothetical protein